MTIAPPEKPMPADRKVPKVGLSVEEAAWSLGISETKMYKMISEGKIPVCKVGANSIIDPDDLKEVMQKSKILKNQ